MCPGVQTVSSTSVRKVNTEQKEPRCVSDATTPDRPPCPHVHYVRLDTLTSKTMSKHPATSKQPTRMLCSLSAIWLRHKISHACFHLHAKTGTNTLTSAADSATDQWQCSGTGCIMYNALQEQHHQCHLPLQTVPSPEYHPLKTVCTIQPPMLLLNADFLPV